MSRFRPTPSATATDEPAVRPAPPASAANAAAAASSVAALAYAPAAHASFLPPEMMDSAAMGLAWFVVIVMPIAGIVLFWMVHVLPEKIAHKRHHPQTDAIKTLCLLSLVFGGLLWPIAWLWAYVKPVAYKLAYGTGKHDDYFHHMAEKARNGQLDAYELDHLREELDAMADAGGLSADLKRLRRELTSARPAEAAPTAGSAAAAATERSA